MSESLPECGILFQPIELGSQLAMIDLEATFKSILP